MTPTGSYISSEHKKTLLAVLWATYYFAVNSIGRFEEYTRPVIWLGGLAVGLITVQSRAGAIIRLPAECFVLVIFLIWTTTGLFFLTDYEFYWLYWRLIVQLLLLIYLIIIAIKYTGGMNWFYASFILSAVFNVLMSFTLTDADSNIAIDGQLRQEAIGGGANTLGWYSFMGTLGVMVLFGEPTSFKTKAVLLIAFASSLYGLVVSASRGAFVAFLMAIILWPFMCLRLRRQREWIFWIMIVAISFGSYQFYGSIYKRSLLAKRFTAITTGEENQPGYRLNLIRVGFRIFSENPVFGVGLGQFPIASGTGLYAHNEWIELSATTGAFGLILYLMVYVIAWKRLNRALRYAKNSMVLYRVNCARMTLIIVVASGMLYKPNFITIPCMFLIALTVGTAHWAEQLEYSTRYSRRN